MSYIRSLSNPEGLYIWWDIDGRMVIWPSGDKTYYFYSAEKFDEFMQKFIDNNKKFPFSLNGIEVWEDAVQDYKICLAVPIDGKIKKFYMYLVTWEHIIRSFQWHRNLNFIQKIIYIWKNWWKIGRTI